jgi:opacity protein-like surface antigen
MNRKYAAAAAGLAITLIVANAAPGHAQDRPSGRQAGAAMQPRVYFSAWAGHYTSIGGFVEPEPNDFFTFDRPFVYGGGLHVRVNQGIVVGVDGAIADVDYERRERGQIDVLSSGSGRVATALLSARLNTGTGPGFNLYLTGGAGVQAYELPEPEFDGWDRDLALMLGLGLDYRLHPRFGFFVEYGQFWAYHQKGDDLSRNTANHDVLRLGARFGL